MKIPYDFSEENETCVCRLQKYIDCLKHASRNWHHKFTKFLLSMNFRQSIVDHSLFLQKKYEFILPF